MKITISGTPGSGKTTVGKLLAKELKFNFFSAGEFMRELAKKKGISLMELSKTAVENRETDDAIDNWVAAIGETDENFVMDGRVAFNFIPESIKIFLEVSEDEAARRVYEQLRPDEKENTSHAATFENIKKRKEFENARYKKYYNLDYTSPDNYDLVVDTTSMPIEKVVKKISDFIRHNYTDKKAKGGK